MTTFPGNTTTKNASITVTNTTGASTQLTAAPTITKTTNGGGTFSITGGTCTSGTTLATNGTCTIAVRYVPGDQHQYTNGICIDQRYGRSWHRDAEERELQRKLGSSDGVDRNRPPRQDPQRSRENRWKFKFRGRYPEVNQP